MIQNKAQTFLDGIVKIYRVEEISQPGDMPKDGLVLKNTLRYHRRTVGVSRYYTALQAQQKADAVLRCPYRETVSTQDIAVVDGKQYLITFIQRPEEIRPPVMDLTLSRLEKDYGEIKEG